MAWQEFFDYGFQFTPIPAGAGLLFQPNFPPVRIDTGSDFLWMKSLYAALNAQIRVTFQDNRLGRQLTTAPVILRSIASNFAGVPFKIPPPYYELKAGSSFVINAADASGAINALGFVMQGAKMRAGIAPWEQAEGQWKNYRAKVPFIYNSGIQAIGALATASFVIPVENDAPFLVQQMMGEHNGAVNALTIDIRDTTSIENNWMNVPVPFETVFGTGQFPNVMYDPHRYPFNRSARYVGGGGQIAVITMNVQNLTAFPINFEVAFSGLKLFL